MIKYIQSVSFSIKLTTFGWNMIVYVHANGKTFSIATIESVKEPITAQDYDDLQTLAEEIALSCGYTWKES